MISLVDISYPGPGRPIDGYGPGFFRVDGTVVRGAVIVAPDGVRSWGGFSDRAPLLALAGRIDVLLLGMGRTILPPDPELVSVLGTQGIGAEPMDSAAAARTYNMLLAEGRRIAAALIPV